MPFSEGDLHEREGEIGTLRRKASFYRYWLVQRENGCKQIQACYLS